jgi:hypothetical protein
MDTATLMVIINLVLAQPTVATNKAKVQEKPYHGHQYCNPYSMESDWIHEDQYTTNIALDLNINSYGVLDDNETVVYSYCDFDS